MNAQHAIRTAADGLLPRSLTSPKSVNISARTALLAHSKARTRAIEYSAHIRLCIVAELPERIFGAMYVLVNQERAYIAFTGWARRAAKKRPLSRTSTVPISPHSGATEDSIMGAPRRLNEPHGRTVGAAGARYGPLVASPRPEPIRTNQLAPEVRGHWIAMKNGEVVDAGRTFDELQPRLHERDITDVTVMRVPSEHEPELVGLG